MALYTPRGALWAMTERGHGALERDATTLRIGSSALSWDGNALTISVNEYALPWPRRLRGAIRIATDQPPGSSLLLDGSGRHRWTPLWPRTTAEISLTSPAWSWRGHAYVDSNQGDRPLEHDFARWNWARGDLSVGSTVVYDTVPHNGEPRSLALRFNAEGELSEAMPPPAQALPPTRWRLERSLRAEGPVTLRRTLEDTPFYARSLVDARLFGEDRTLMHESLSLDRFRQPWVQALLPFRMPRRPG